VQHASRMCIYVLSPSRYIESSNAVANNIKIFYVGYKQYIYVCNRLPTTYTDKSNAPVEIRWH